MDGSTYRERVLSIASGIELIIALYDAAIRFLHRAIECVEEDDVRGRRVVVKKAVDILMYLQARLRPDLGPAPAAALSDFYTAMFTMTLEASHAASREQFREVIGCIANVREAWVIAAKDPAVNHVRPRESRRTRDSYMPTSTSDSFESEAAASSWRA
jgi:flagellar protein FliS